MDVAAAVCDLGSERAVYWYSVPEQSWPVACMLADTAVASCVWSTSFVARWSMIESLSNGSFEGILTYLLASEGCRDCGDGLTVPERGSGRAGMVVFGEVSRTPGDGC